MCPLLFDHLIGALQERLRDGEAERLGGLEIDDQLEFRRWLDRQIAGLGALENTIDICRRTPVEVGQINAVRNKTATTRELAMFAAIRRASSFVSSLLPPSQTLVRLLH